jgi:PIN domain nuclease of toxin-antitoxin system
MILLDTHVLLWWQAGGERLSSVARKAIDDSLEIRVSPLTCLELATLARRGRIDLDRSPATWASDLFAEDRLAVAPLSVEAAIRAGTFDDSFPGDPIDRLLYATALDQRLQFVSKDERLRAYAAKMGDLAIVW